jgi:hypothetical protein
MQRSQFALPCLLLTLGVASGGVAGCDDEFSDEEFGVLDLASYYDGGTQANPAAGIPEQLEANPGFLDGQAAEYYDFGFVPSLVELTTGVPTAVRVQPMYFFFDHQSLPLFAPPVRELRNGIDWIRGGHDVLNPNPKDFCQGAADQVACKEINEAEKRKSYPLRRRDPLIDPNRGTDDYQRPLIDLSPLDRGGPATEYTGLWEIIEVIAPPKYEPDAIKHVATVQKAVAEGEFKLRATGKVINCPLIDERTYVNRGMTSRRIFRPRIEVWYRRLLGYCFLANGWETLGREDGVRYFAGVESDVDRLDTFDVNRLTLGEGPNATQRVLVPVGKAYNPAIIVDDQSFVNPPAITRIAYNTITASRPRHTAGDPPGYTPMRWMFDVPAPDDYESGAWKAVGDLDLSNALPRMRNTIVPIVHNLPARGVASRCSFAPVERHGGRCGVEKQDPNLPPGNTYIDPAGDPTCNMERDPFNPEDPPLECNPDSCFCDAPFVGYGQACGPGVAQCSRKADKFADDGYRCFPPWGGYCQKSCLGPNTLSAENVGKEPTKWVDSRCGGAPGFICLGSIATCIKLCDQNVTDPKQCSVETLVGMETREIQEGQICQDYGLHVCTWPDTWDPKEFPIPQ